GLSDVVSLALVDVRLEKGKNLGGSSYAASGLSVATFGDAHVTITCLRCVVSRNRGHSAVFVGASGNAAISLSLVTPLVVRNRPGGGGGGTSAALAEGQLQLNLSSATITGSRAGQGGGLTLITSGATGTATLDLRNTILWGNGFGASHLYTPTGADAL